MAEQAAKNLHQRLSAALGLIKTLKKDQQGQMFKFAGIAAINEEVRAALVQSGISHLVTTSSLEITQDHKTKAGELQYYAKVSCEHTLINVDNPADATKATFHGTALDSGALALAKAYTDETKNFLKQTFLIPIEAEDQDGQPGGSGRRNPPPPSSHQADPGGGQGKKPPEAAKPGSVEERFEKIIPTGTDRAALDAFLDACMIHYKAKRKDDIREMALNAKGNEFWKNFDAWMKKRAETKKEDPKGSEDANVACPDKGMVSESECGKCTSRQGCPVWE